MEGGGAAIRYLTFVSWRLRTDSGTRAGLLSPITCGSSEKIPSAPPINTSQGERHVPAIGATHSGLSRVLCKRLHQLDSGQSEGLLERLRHLASPHRWQQQPRDDVALVVVHHRRQLVPTPTDDAKANEICLPHLVDAFRRVVKRGARVHQHEPLAALS